MQVLCTKAEGYTWTVSGGVHFRGYIQRGEDLTPLRGEAAAECFSSIRDLSDLQARLAQMDGVFSLIVEQGERVWAAVDISRSMPLYFARDCSVVSDSAEAIRGVLGLAGEDADPYALEELLAGSFIGHTRTAYAQIGQIDAGQAAEFGSQGMRTARYYVHCAKTVSMDRQAALAAFQAAADQAFDAILAAVAGRPIVLSLSGGYDSRYVACMLKSRGAQDVSCYTYGRADSREIRQSKAVAEALGYRWQCVEHTNANIEAILDESSRAYFEGYEGHDYTVYLQNYAAVKALHESGWFKPGSVFLTGLCNDMPTGEYVTTQDRIADYAPTPAFLAAYIQRRRDGKGTSWREGGRQSYIDEARRQIDEMGIEIESYQDFVRAFDAVWTTLEHSRCFLHMNDVHAYFGYEWLLPCWNKKSLAFWYSMPMEYRLAQNLYEEWIMTGLPAKYGVGDKKKVVSYSLYKGLPRFKARCRLVLRRAVCMPLGLVLREETDYNHFDPLMNRLYRRIHQKRLIGFRRTNYIFVLTLYLMERRYGEGFYTAIEKADPKNYAR